MTCIKLSFVFIRHFASDIRVRFAPSPTGTMHLGGLRTAFYNYLFARRNEGKFILRIEDTDQKRIKEGSTENIISVLSWTGLLPDEGPSIGGKLGPYIQSQRTSIYEEHANQLLKSNAAYRCFCSEIRLNLLKKEAQSNRQLRGYDNKCRHLEPEEIEQFLKDGKSFTIRFKIPECPVFHEDIVYGSQTFNVSESEGDFVIMKSDGFPTYHFACVVDDHLMEISHVLRGMEWLVSTPKHLMLYRTFGWDPPKYAHLPLLTNSDRTKLSKRQAAIGIDYFKSKQYSPVAVLNFLASAGGGFGKPEKLVAYDLETLCSKFNLEDIHTNSCIVDLEKLDILNHDYLKQQLGCTTTTTKLIKELRAILLEKYGERYKSEEEHLPDDYIEKILKCYKERLNSMACYTDPDMEYLWTSVNVNEVKERLALSEIPSTVINSLPQISSLLSTLPEAEYQIENISSLLKGISHSENIPFVQMMKTLRIVLTNRKDGPGVSEILAMLGKNRSLKKLSNFTSQFCQTELESCTSR